MVCPSKAYIAIPIIIIVPRKSLCQWFSVKSSQLFGCLKYRNQISLYSPIMELPHPSQLSVSAPHWHISWKRLPDSYFPHFSLFFWTFNCKTDYCRTKKIEKNPSETIKRTKLEDTSTIRYGARLQLGFTGFFVFFWRGYGSLIYIYAYLTVYCMITVAPITKKTEEIRANAEMTLKMEYWVNK